ncbi:MAG: VCBS repeat-containing protein [Byssovorax sp.]
MSLAACSSDHHVSAWGAAGSPRLGAYLETPDLDARLALVDTETAALGLHLTDEIPITLAHGGGAARIRGYEGTDTLGRPVHAIRVATARSVVMAVGPVDSHDTARDGATELVPALLVEDGGRRGSAFRSGTDLTGDGAIAVVAKGETGQLAIWRITSLGAAPYPIAMAAPPTRALDVDGDGRVDLVGDLATECGDAIAPRLSDAATFDGVGYSNRTEGARAFHAALAEAAPPRNGDAPASDELRLRRAVERAWHAVQAGKSREDARSELDREVVPARLRAAFDRCVSVLSPSPGARGPRTPGGT